MNLTVTEIRRLLARRAVLMLLALCVVLPAVIWLSHAWNTRPVQGDELREAIAQVQRDPESVAACMSAPGDFGVPVSQQADLRAGCVETIARSWYLSRPTLDLPSATHDVGMGVSVVVIGLLGLAATTFAGADWNTGSVANQLLFEPRRGRVWVAEAVAVGAVTLVATLVVLALWWVALWTLAHARGTAIPDGTGDAVLGLIGRSLVLSVAFAIGCYAMTMLLRSTVGTLGVLFTVSIGATLLIASLPLGVPELWMPHLNVQAWLENGAPYWPADGCFDYLPSGEEIDCQRTLGLVRSSTYLGTLLALVGVASFASFRRRDVV